MVARAVLAGILTATLATLASASTIYRYGKNGGGGTVRSLDGKWTIWAPPEFSLNDSAFVHVWLVGKDGQKRRLMRWSRILIPIWTKDGDHVILNAVDLETSTVAVFDLAAKQRADPYAIDKQIDAAMRSVRPSLGDIDNRRHEWGELHGRPCVMLEEDGLPLGRTKGSLVSRQAVFMLDLRANRAVRIATCPGAKLF